MRRKPTEKRSRNLDGISKSITVASSNVVASRDARVAKEVVQRGHILLSLLAFLRLETHRLNTGSSWYESERSIHRSASSLFIASPVFESDYFCSAVMNISCSKLPSTA